MVGRRALCSSVLVAFDADASGDEASAWRLKALGPRAKRWRPYWDDPNAMLQGGVDLRTTIGDRVVPLNPFRYPQSLY